MKLDDVIAELVRLRARHGGDIQVRALRRAGMGGVCAAPAVVEWRADGGRDGSAIHVVGAEPYVPAYPYGGRQLK